MVHVEGTQVAVNSKYNTYRVRLNSERDPIMPFGKDITSIIINNKTEYLDKIHIDIGRFHILTFDTNDIICGENILEGLGQGILSSKAHFLYFDVVFEFKKEYLGKHKEKKRGSSTKVFVDVPDFEISFVDGELGILNPRTPFWEKIKINPNNVSIEEVHRLHTTYYLQTLDGSSLEDVMQKGEPFFGKILNYIRYNDGCAGKGLSFFYE